MVLAYPSPIDRTAGVLARNALIKALEDPLGVPYPGSEAVGCGRDGVLYIIWRRF